MSLMTPVAAIYIIEHLYSARIHNEMFKSAFKIKQRCSVFLKLLLILIITCFEQVGLELRFEGVDGCGRSYFPRQLVPLL